MNPSPREHEPMLAALARSAERSNTPTGMIVFCAALLLGSAVFAFSQVREASAARSAFVSQQRARAEVLDLAREIKTFRAEETLGASSAKAYEPKELLAAIERAAQFAKLSPSPIVTDRKEDTPGPLQRKVVSAIVRGQPIESVFEWMAAAVAETPGLHVIGLTMRASVNDGWDIEVKFARWELKK